MPPKRTAARVTSIGITGSDAPIAERKYSDRGSTVVVKQVRRTIIDEIVDAGGSLNISREDKAEIIKFLKFASDVRERISQYIELNFELGKEDTNRIRAMMNKEDEDEIDRGRLVNNLITLMKNKKAVDYDKRGLSQTDISKINKFLTYNKVEDLELEIGYMLRDEQYGIEAVRKTIEDYYTTIDNLVHMDENHRLLYDQMIMAFNPMSGIELLPCKACGSKTYISGLVTTRAWDEAQETTGTCYNNTCRLFKG